MQDSATDAIQFPEASIQNVMTGILRVLRMCLRLGHAGVSWGHFEGIENASGMR